VLRADDAVPSLRVLARGQRVVVEDVQRDDAYEAQRALGGAPGVRALHCTPLRAHDGGLLGILTMHFRAPHRPSEREEQLLDLYARHASDLVERMRFEQALRHADRRKDEFLATLAHELRNPLAPIRNSLAIMGAAGPLPDRIEKARQIMGRQVHHLVRLVDDLLDASRITLGKVQLRKERVSLPHVLREAVETVAPNIQAAGHQLHVALPEHDELEVEADPTRIAQVVVNLLNNATQFTARGGNLWLTLERDGDQAMITVRDTGAGIDAAHLESVFEMFSQPAPALYRTEGGLGIGLAIVRGLVQLHGGSVVAHSAGPDKGSEFVVRLPLLPRADDAAPAQAVAADASTAHARKRVLVVDDNRDLAASLRELLEMQGHDVREAHDGVEGVHVASEFKPDLVLLDIGMPRMNGYEAAGLIRRRLRHHAVRIVAITGWGHENDKLKALEAGFDLHMTKPVDPAAVAQLLA
jgi:signal transduction histidine kinase